MKIGFLSKIKSTGILWKVRQFSSSSMCGYGLDKALVFRLKDYKSGLTVALARYLALECRGCEFRARYVYAIFCAVEILLPADYYVWENFGLSIRICISTK